MFTSPFAALLIAIVLLVLGIVLVTAVRTAANVGMLSFLLGGAVLFIGIPAMMRALPDETYDWMFTAKDWIGLILLAAYLGMLAWMLIYVYAEALASDAENIGFCGIYPQATAPTQMPASWLAYVAGWILAAATVLVVLFWLGSHFTDAWSWFTRPTLRTLVARMQDLDAHNKKEEFKATSNPMFFTLPTRFMTKESKEAWQAAAQRKAAKEGDYVIEEILSIKFHSQDGRNLTHARIHFKGKHAKADYSGKITIERRIFGEDQATIARIVHKVLEELPPPPQNSGKSSLELGKVVVPVPDPFAVEKD